MKSSTETGLGIRTGHFSNAVIILRDVLNLEMVYHDKEEDLAKFKLPSGQIMEVFGPKRIWHPFNTPPDWEMIIADIRYMKDKS